MLIATIVVPGVESLLEQVETTPGPHCIAVYIEYAFSAISVYKVYKKVLFHLVRHSVHLHCFLQAMPTLLFFAII